VRAVAFDLGERHGRCVCIAGRLEVVAQIAICKVDVQVQVCVVGNVWESILGDGRVGVDCRGCG
jgi:hypothetical protein